MAAGDGHAPALPVLDGMRGLACLLVVASHLAAYWINNPAGVIGVGLFFVLSGFLMAHHYLPGQLSARYWAAYLLRRFVRIYPLFMLITFLGWLLTRYTSFWVWEIKDFTTEKLLAHWTLQQGQHVFWSIVVEMKFYAAFALLAAALLCLPVPPARKPWLILALWAAAMLGGETLSSESIALWPYLPYLLGGVVVQQFWQHKRLDWLPGGFWNTLCAFAALFLLWYIARNSTPERLMQFWPPFWKGVPATMLLLLGTLRASGPVTRAFMAHPLRFTGRISYGLYLVHLLIFDAFYIYWPADGPVTALHMAIAIIIAFLLSWILYRTIEHPCNQFSKYLSKHLLS